MRGAEVGDPSRLFLSERRPGNAGSVVTPAMEGSRPILVEIQALVGPRCYGVPQRRSIGIDYNRLCMLLAVLETRAGVNLRDRDVFVSVAGGLTVDEPATDCAIGLALASSAADRPVDAATIAIGEIGLGGELRACAQAERRLRVAAKMGFTQAVMPRSNAGGGIEGVGMKLIPCDSLRDAIAAVIRGQQ
ncbi:MAG: hypothetical protein NT045_05355 [Candidatus Aureabacteria bacterium]|nr:hypothetical protein [Candidatus Auribacterota bacterium]